MFRFGAQVRIGDQVGRLTSVTQTLNPGAANQQNLVTSYGYDEVGERISQTDANNHTTLFGYDQLGRRSSRTLPAGGTSEAYAYDAAGNLKSKTDFNGHTTTYAYDNMNRLQSKTADAFFSTGTCVGGACGATSVSFTYTATGRRKSMTDATGTTTYTYDNRDRLQSKATPFGTVTYTYDAAGNDLTLGSSNAGGASMTYTYDALNRLASVTDPFGTGGALETTTYSYDAVGNLAGYAYPNGVSTGYSYDNLNRLTSMRNSCGTAAPGCGPANTVISSYAYTLGPTGNRLSVAELSGRSVTYGYDDLYRLTSETVASDPKGNNGQVTYTLDNVGNRLQLNSTLAAIVPSGLLSYDANDRVSTDTFDANGNTTINSGQTNVYDFENHLVQRGGVTVVYDGDGNRVKETVAGVTTSYLVADQNPTGYAQVLDELQNGAVSRTYSYGLSLISQKLIANGQGPFFYGYDGHGSVRFLTDSTGAITDTYDYDAFGTLISSTGSTPNNYLFAGEQFDPALGIYYNRARYYDQRQGRFWTMDTYEGYDDEPVSLHKYLYVYNNPVDNIDRCGKCVPSTGNYGDIVQREIFKDFISQKPTGVLTNTAISTILGQTVSGGRLLPDLIDPVTLSNLGFGEIWEIKSIYSAPAAEAKLALYLTILNKYSKILKWIPGVSYVPPPVIRIDSDVIATTEEPAPGVITYCVLSLDEMERLVVLAQQAMLADLFVSLGTAELEDAYAQ